MFECNKCGECCRNLHLSSIYEGLHDGDGICRYLSGNECTIYDTRPLICRVDESYNTYFKDKLTYEEYLQINYKSCEILRDKKGK